MQREPVRLKKTFCLCNTILKNINEVLELNVKKKVEDIEALFLSKTTERITCVVSHYYYKGILKQDQIRVG